jgi:hypothetical protein
MAKMEKKMDLMASKMATREDVQQATAVRSETSTL